MAEKQNEAVIVEMDEEAVTTAEKTAINQQKKAKKKSKGDFPKEKLLTFKQFKDRRDLLSVLLEDGKRYTIKEAQEAIDKFMKGAK